MIESLETSTNVQIVTQLMKNIGFEMDGKKQRIDGIGSVYPQNYFSPYDYINLINKKDKNTYTMHHFYKSWVSPKDKLKSGMKKMIATTIGGENIAKLRGILTK